MKTPLLLLLRMLQYALSSSSGNHRGYTEACTSSASQELLHWRIIETLTCISVASSPAWPRLARSCARGNAAEVSQPTMCPDTRVLAPVSFLHSACDRHER